MAQEVSRNFQTMSVVLTGKPGTGKSPSLSKGILPQHTVVRLNLDDRKITRRNEKLQMILTRVLTPHARQRLSILSLLQPKIAKQIENTIIQQVQMESMPRTYTEAEIVNLLDSMSSSQAKRKGKIAMQPERSVVKLNTDRANSSELKSMDGDDENDNGNHSDTSLSTTFSNASSVSDVVIEGDDAHGTDVVDIGDIVQKKLYLLFMTGCRTQQLIARKIIELVAYEILSNDPNLSLRVENAVQTIFDDVPEVQDLSVREKDNLKKRTMYQLLHASYPTCPNSQTINANNLQDILNDYYPNMLSLNDYQFIQYEVRHQIKAFEDEHKILDDETSSIIWESIPFFFVSSIAIRFCGREGFDRMDDTNVSAIFDGLVFGANLFGVHICRRFMETLLERPQLLLHLDEEDVSNVTFIELIKEFYNHADRKRIVLFLCNNGKKDNKKFELLLNLIRCKKINRVAEEKENDENERNWFFERLFLYVGWNTAQIYYVSLDDDMILLLQGKDTRMYDLVKAKNVLTKDNNNSNVKFIDGRGIESLQVTRFVYQRFTDIEECDLSNDEFFDGAHEKVVGSSERLQCNLEELNQLTCVIGVLSAKWEIDNADNLSTVQMILSREQSDFVTQHNVVFCNFVGTNFERIRLLVNRVSKLAVNSTFAVLCVNPRA